MAAPIRLSFTKLVVGDLERSRFEPVGFLADPDGHVAEIVRPAAAR